MSDVVLDLASPLAAMVCNYRGLPRSQRPTLGSNGVTGIGMIGH